MKHPRATKGMSKIGKYFLCNNVYRSLLFDTFVRVFAVEAKSWMVRVIFLLTNYGGLEVCETSFSNRDTLIK